MITGKIRTFEKSNVDKTQPVNAERSLMIKGPSEIAEMSCHAVRKETINKDLVEVLSDALNFN